MALKFILVNQSRLILTIFVGLLSLAPVQAPADEFAEEVNVQRQTWCDLALRSARNISNGNIFEARTFRGPGIELQVYGKNRLLLLAPNYSLHQISSHLKFYSWGPFRDKSLLKKSALALLEFDQMLSLLGFKVPTTTTLIFANHPWDKISERLEPFGLSTFFPTIETPDQSSFALLDDRGHAIVVMNPIPIYALLYEQSILFHERAHTILYQTFGSRSTIIQNRIFNEALADFSASLATRSSIIGIPGELVIRDMEWPPKLRERDFNQKHPHAVSTLLSSALWRLKRIVGQHQLERDYLRILRKVSAEFTGLPVPNDKASILESTHRFIEIAIAELESAGQPLSPAQRAEVHGQAWQ